MCQLIGQRQILLSLISGIAKHDTLVFRAELHQEATGLLRCRGLMLYSHEHIASFVIESLL